MEERISCTRCHSAIYPPPAEGEYACPVCGSRLPRRCRRSERTTTWSDRVARASLAVGCLATISAVGWHLIVTPYARTARSGEPLAVSARPPYSPSEEQRYRLRIRQLEADLQRAPREYGVIMKLGMLYRQLGVRQQDPLRRTADLTRARELFERAMQEGVAVMRRDFEFAAYQFDRLSGRYPLDDSSVDQMPGSDPIATTTPYAVDLEESLHGRLLHARASLARAPDNPRLLCRLGWTYYRLAQAMTQRGSSRTLAFYYESAQQTPSELVAEGIAALNRAARVARTREYRVEAYLGLMAIYQSEEQWEKALEAIERVVALQPNNWTAHQRRASLLIRLGRHEEAARALKNAESWETSDWL